MAERYTLIYPSTFYRNLNIVLEAKMGSVALPGKILLVRIIKINKIDAYLRPC